MDRAAAHLVARSGGGDRTIILAHGLGGDPGQWRALVRHFERQYSVVTYALAGNPGTAGELFSPARHNSILGFAEDLAVLCRELDLTDAIYVGHSMSGMAGLLAQAGDPGLFSALVTVNASPRYLDDPATGYVGGFTEEQVEQVMLDLAGDYTLWASGFGRFVMGNEDRPEYATEFVRTLSGLQPEVASVVFRAAFTSDFRGAVPRVSAPVLVLQSHADPAVPLAAARWLADALPAGRFRGLDATGHFPHVVDPVAVIAAIEEFVAEQA